MPTAKEWQGAPRFSPDRISDRAAGCVASQVREWVRVRCPDKTFAISLLGGSNEGLAFWIGPEAEGGWGEVQFPVRRGDRRVVQLWSARPDGAGGSIIEPSIVLQEHWLATEARPRISAL